MNTPTAKKLPYLTEVPCKVCHPADQDGPPAMECREERAHQGSVLHRVLVCPNCGTQDDDLYDPISKTVVFNRELDDAAAMGRGKRSDIG